jgi:Holliday junction resolvase-like predicted endonuclease
MQTLTTVKTGQTHTDPNLIGDMSEYYAVTWLWDNGYLVYKNAGCTGPVDLVAMKGSEVILIDVKTTRTAHNAASYRTDLQKELGVVILEYNADTRKLRFKEHRDVT